MTAYELRISDWSSDVCSSDLRKGDRIHDIARRNAHQPNDEKLVAGPKSSGNEPAVTDGPDRVDDALLDLVAGPHHQCRRVATLVAADTLQIGRASCRERVCQYV